MTERSTAEATDLLLARVARGDRQAFEALYQATSATLLGICMRLLADRSEAEDVLQEVYVAAWGKAAQFDPSRAGALTWLGTIARHRAIDRLRALPAAVNHAPIELAEATPDEAP
jgi:RNA polymerase sigma-70 factor (ECF subfamily)